MKKPAVILVSPQGGANVGGVARSMMNFGLDDLRIVQARCDLAGDDVKMMSLKAFALIQNAKLYDSLAEAQRDLSWSFAFSANAPQPGLPIIDLRSFSEEGLSRIESNANWAMVFGREERGLLREEISSCDTQVKIPVSEAYDSLNLSSAVAVAIYECYARSTLVLDTLPKKLLTKPRKKDEEAFFVGLKNFLNEIGFTHCGSASEILIELQDMSHRARLSDRDLRILFGILADLEYRMQKKFFPN